MKTLVVCAIALTLSPAAHAQRASSSATASSSNEGAVTTASPGADCRTVYLKPGEKAPRGVSSSASAGSGSTSSVASGGGLRSETSVGDGASATSMSSSTSDGRTVVTSSDGNCTVYIHPEAKDRDKR